MKKIFKCKIYKDIENEIFKHKVITKTKNKKDILSALAIITNDILIKYDIPSSYYLKFLKQIKIKTSIFKDDLL